MGRNPMTFPLPKKRGHTTMDLIAVIVLATFWLVALIGFAVTLYEDR
jgi:hypothetical protein